MKIMSYGHIKPESVACSGCGAVLEYVQREVKSLRNLLYINCPVCGKAIVLTKPQQPVADMVEVIRCRDCKSFVNGACDEIAYIIDGYYRGTFEMRDSNDFCSRAERKE